MLEVIKCKCGKPFAACVDGMQNTEWSEQKKEYLKGGCSIDFMEPQSFTFQSCNCPKTEKEILKRTQYKLFEFT